MYLCALFLIAHAYYMHRRTGYILLLLLAVLPAYGFRIVSYNVENLFDCTPDSLHDDSEYTEQGLRHWTHDRYYLKREHIARTIVNIGGWEGVAVVGLCEVENEQCIRDLCSQNLRNLPYAYIHFDSPDRRGIDVALLYRTDLFRVHKAYPIRVPVENGERPTRDILYASGTTPAGDSLHLFVCHLPSQLGGATSSDIRQRAKQTIAAHVDSLLTIAPDARIIVMGDMNSSPQDDLRGLTNLMLHKERQGLGTYKYQGVWSCIDQFYVSAALADTAQASIYEAPWLLTPDDAYTGYKPLRTYNGYLYNRNGYSDHLPILLDLPGTQENTVTGIPIESIIEDIYSQVTEDGTDGSNQDFETLAEDLLARMQQPISLNADAYDALSDLPMLSQEQTTAILLKARDLPFNSLYELQLVSGLKDYEIRNLLPFVQVGEPQTKPFYWRDLAAYGRHDLSLRADVRNIEAYSGTDPVYLQAKYGYRFRRQVAAGVTLRRPAAGSWQDLQYGAYIQLSDIGVLKRLVAGCYQARFGQGLVTNHFFHTGKSSHVMQAGYSREGLSKISSAGSERYQGIGATFRAGKHTEVSGWYSVDNSKVWHHAIGANVALNFRRLHVGFTAMEHLYSDSLPVRNTYYNQAYFRGKHQLVVGADLRYAWRWLQLFAEVAAAQNSTWGAGVIAGTRLTPINDLGLVALYRYYSPTFDNRFGYAFSEGSRLGDENGGYIGIEYKGLRHWRLSAYGDVFRFNNPKFGIRETGTIGYDVLAQTEYMSANYNLLLQLRSRSKGSNRTHRARAEFTYLLGTWRLHSRADALLGEHTDGSAPLGYALSIYQDIEYHLSSAPVVLQLRLQGFDAREWTNRIYTYENDVLYAFNIPAVYGRGGRWYINARYHITKQLSVYLRVSQTVYHPSWAAEKNRPITKSDIHLLLRAQL